MYIKKLTIALKNWTLNVMAAAQEKAWLISRRLWRRGNFVRDKSTKFDGAGVYILHYHLLHTALVMSLIVIHSNNSSLTSSIIYVSCYQLFLDSGVNCITIVCSVLTFLDLTCCFNWLLK